MIGSVNPNREAVVVVRLRAVGGTELLIPTVIDTGFNQWLTLTPQYIREIGFKFRTETRYSLAGGSDRFARLFEAEIEWLGGWKPILILETDGDVLLGMAMLQGSFLGIEATDGGRVEIRPLKT